MEGVVTVLGGASGPLIAKHTRQHPKVMAVRVEQSGPVVTVINDRIEARNAGDPETAEAAMEREWANGVEAHFKEGAAGATRFSAGRGRHGDFEAI